VVMDQLSWNVRCWAVPSPRALQKLDTAARIAPT
jgi:hypothetical protein